jgi:hypothetical protein
MWKLALVLLAMLMFDEPTRAESPKVYQGFDRNEYPGDATLPALRKSFSYTSYWLNNPAGANQNSWVGKRALIKQHGFGFLILFNGRVDAELKKGDAAKLGALDGKAAVTAARREGFQANVVIFLDQEEGGRLLPEQAAYVFAWVDAVRLGGDRAGIYCSGIAVPDGSSVISTAQDIVARELARTPASSNKGSFSGRSRKLVLWVANDQCPPSPGCARNTKPPSDGFPSSISTRPLVWQYAQSPRRAQFSLSCPKNNDADSNCYAPGLAHSAATFLDLNVSDSPDPSTAP